MSSILDEVLERVNILDVVSQYVKLRRTGRNFVGLCPFHKEKTPSFTVNQEKQIFYCFGCHEGGNAVHFLAKYDRTSFQEALESLAEQSGVEYRKKMGGQRRTPIFEAMGKLADYYHGRLRNARFALKYLTDRGLDEKTIDEFNLGYSDRVTQAKELSGRLGIPLDILVSVGIMKLRGNETYDVFRGRIIIPILDINKKVIGFGGRGIGKEVLPKYLNSPESSIFSKRSVLFGIDKAKKEIVDKDEVIVVEGYFDLISLHKAGIRNSTATLGTSITEEQVTRLRNYTENVTLMLDGDEAGVKSALRVIGLFGDMGINGNMVVLPEGYDPDSLMREQGIEAFRKIVEERKPLLDYFFDFHVKRCGVRTLEGKLSFIKTVVPCLEGMKDNVSRRLYTKRLSELTGVEEYRFWDSTKERRIERGTITDQPKSVIERKIIGILVNRPHLVESFRGKGVEAYIKDEKLQEVFSKMLDCYGRNGFIETKHFVSLLEKEETRDCVLSSVLEAAECDETEMEKTLSDYFSHMKRKFVQEEAKRITDGLADAEKRGDEKMLMDLLEKKKQVLDSLKPKSAK